jgi:hypothetical protein
VENGVACYLAGGFIWSVLCFVLEGCGVVVMEQVTRGSRCDKGKGRTVLPAMMAAVGALQRGVGGGSAHGGGHACVGHR